MTLARYALVDDLGNTINLTVWDEKAQYEPPPGLTMIREHQASALEPLTEKQAEAEAVAAAATPTRWLWWWKR